MGLPRRAPPLRECAYVRAGKLTWAAGLLQVVREPTGHMTQLLQPDRPGLQARSWNGLLGLAALPASVPRRPCLRAF